MLNKELAPGAAGIEPAITVLETVAMPFNYAPMLE